MSETDYQIDVMVDGPDRIVAIKPPVEPPFREIMYEKLNELGLIKEIAIREGSFFGTQHLPSGALYSELRIPDTALKVTGQGIMSIAHTSADVIRDQGGAAEVSPYLLATGGSRRLFQRSAPNS